MIGADRRKNIILKISVFLLILAAGGIIIFRNIDEPEVDQSSSRPEGTLTINYANEANNFGYPLNIRHSDCHYAWWGGLQSLVQLSTETPGELVPVLAEKWEFTEDRSSCTFFLRKGIKFHDGTDFNAHAVKWNMEKVIASERDYLKNVKSIDIVDYHTIRFNISSWDTLFLSDFASDACLIISPTAFEANGGEEWANKHPVGTGPFKLKEYKRNSYIKFERFNDYWEENIPYLESLIVYHIPDPMTAMASFLRGELMALRMVDMITAKQIKDSSDKFNFEVCPGGNMAIYFNTINPESIWADKRMREALEYAIDKKEITESLGFGFIDPLYNIIFGINEAGNPKTTPRKYDPDKARQLIKEAGHKERLKIKCSYNIGFHSDLFVALQKNLSEVGIDLELNAMSHTATVQLNAHPSPGNDLRFTRLRGRSPLVRGAYEELSSKSWYFVGVKRTEGFDDSLYSAIKEPDSKKQQELLEEAERIAYEDAMFIPLWTDPSINVVVPELKGAVWWVGRNYPHFERAWLEKQ